MSSPVYAGSDIFPGAFPVRPLVPPRGSGRAFVSEGTRQCLEARLCPVGKFLVLSLVRFITRVKSDP